MERSSGGPASMARLTWALALVALAAAFAATPALASSVHNYVKTWNTPPGSEPQAAAVDSAGNVYVYNAGFHSVSRYDPNGNPVPFTALGSNTIDGNGGTNCPATPADCDRVPLNHLYSSFSFIPQVAVDSSDSPASGYIYVENAGTTNNPAQIEVFAPSGQYLGEINTNSDAPKHINGGDAGVNVDQHGNVYVIDHEKGIIDKFVPIDGNPAHDVMGGQIRPRVTWFESLNEYYFSGTAGAGGDPLSYSIVGGFPPIYPYGPIYGYEQDQYHTVNNSHLGFPSDFYEPPFRPFGYGAFINGNNTWKNLTLDSATGHIYLQSGETIQEWDGHGNQVGAEFGPPYTAFAEQVAIDPTNLATRGAVYVRGAQNNADSVAVFSPPLPTPEVTYGTPSVGHTTAHIVAHLDLDEGPPVTSCKLQWGTTFGYAGGIDSNLFSVVYERPPLKCNEALPLNAASDVSIDMKNLPTEQTIHFRVVAGNVNGLSYGKNQEIHPNAVLELTTGGATDVTATRAQLNGSLDPDGMATSYRFEYGLDTKYNVTTPESSAGSGTGFQAIAPIEVTKLQPGTTYHYRLVAKNELGTTFGTDRIFSAGSSPKVSAVRAINVNAEEADLHADINPVGSATTYRFEYGPTLDYGSSTPVGELPASNENQTVSAHIAGLQNGVYHYRVVATNDLGTTVGDDTTFNFPPPSCPNSHVRQQTGSNYLPDCRAYELVSPASAGATYLVPTDTVPPWGLPYGTGGQEEIERKSYAQNTGAASSPARFNYFGALSGLPGFNTPNTTSDMYVATRSDSDGWKTTYPGPEGDDTFALGSQQCSTDLSRCLVRKANINLGSAVKGESAPYLYAVSGRYLGRLPTNLETVPGGAFFKGEGRASADLSHFVFVSVNPAFAPGGGVNAPGTVYDNDVGEDTVTIASRLSNGDLIGQDPLQASDPLDYLDVPHVSSDGDRILIAVRSMPRCESYVKDRCANPVPDTPRTLYMRVNHAITYEVSQGTPRHLQGVALGGRKVLFSSAEALLPDGHRHQRGPLPMDRAGRLTAAPHHRATRGTGNSDSCSVSWVSGCGVQPLRSCTTTSVGRSVRGEAVGFPRRTAGPRHRNCRGRRRRCSSTRLSSSTPRTPACPTSATSTCEREGQVEYVTTFEPGTQAESLPDLAGRHHLGFVTKARLNGYDNVAAPEPPACRHGPPGWPARQSHAPRCTPTTPRPGPALRLLQPRPALAPTGDARASARRTFHDQRRPGLLRTRDALVRAGHRRLSLTSTSTSTAGRS